MEIGGAERSLLGLLEAIDLNKIDVDLFIYRHTGEFMPLIPKGINVLPEIDWYTTIERPIKEILYEGYFNVVFARLGARIAARRYIRKNGLNERSSILQYVSNWTTPLMPSLAKYGEYDLAISFVTPHNIVRDKVNAKKKVAWIHSDYSSIDINSNLEFPVWNSFDHIISISECAKSNFISIFPQLSGKVIVIENILSPKFVRLQSKNKEVTSEMPNEAGVIKLLSIGRFTTQKNFENIPSVCRAIVEGGVNIKWYLIGYGGDEAIIKDSIANLGMEDRVMVLGKKINPYPYIRACDFYIQPSRYEGKAVTVREAQMLFKPVIITNFPTSNSQLANNIDGVIVPMDNEGMVKGIIDFIHNRELQLKIIKYLQEHDYGNESEVERLDDFF
jgi:glycosyltransferase involved in cell wall biosynthesis